MRLKFMTLTLHVHCSTAIYGNSVGFGVDYNSNHYLQAGIMFYCTGDEGY